MPARLNDRLGAQLVDFTAVRAAANSASARASAGGQPCNVIVACARHVARIVGAPWVVLANFPTP